MPASEFPKIDVFSLEKPTFVLPPNLVKKIAEKSCFSVSQDSSRPAMTGVYFDNKNAVLKIVSTDGFRLSLLEEKGEAEDFAINIPAKIIEELAKMTANSEKEIGCYLNKNNSQITFKLESAEISSRLIEGKYPPYEKIIPNTSSIKITIERQDFLRVVKTSAIFSRDKSNLVNLGFIGDVLKISSSTANFGENESEIDCQKKGEDFEAIFNFRFLLDLLSHLSGKEISLETEGQNKPCVFREPESSGFLHLIMPVKKN
jgi:DNA polymerase-3 subunit beta